MCRDGRSIQGHYGVSFLGTMGKAGMMMAVYSLENNRQNLIILNARCMSCNQITLTHSSMSNIMIMKRLRGKK